jgi:hypothetical protein
MWNRWTPRGRFAALALTCASLADAPAGAQDWQWSFTPYVWASEVGVDASVDDHEILEREADLADVLDALDFIVQAHFEGQKGRHGLMFDLTYQDLGDDDHLFALGGPADGEVVVKSDLEMTILEAGGMFNPRGDGSGFTFLYGARIVDTDLELDARFDFGPGSTPGRRYEASTTLFDGLVGARYIAPLSERWTWYARADASSGGSELIWSAWTGAGFSFGKERDKALIFGYKYMEMEYREEDERAEIEAQTKFGGFITGLKFAF